MHWNYRAILHEHPTGDYYGLHEVFYDAKDRPSGCTRDPVSFVCDGDEGPEALIRSLERALADLRSHPVFEAPKAWDHGEPDVCPFCRQEK